MEIKLKNEDGLKKEFEITVPAHVISTSAAVRLEQIARTYKLPGFRPGNVPLPVLKGRIGKEVFEEVIDKTVDTGVKDLLKQEKLRLAYQPEVKLTQAGDGKDLIINVTLETLPDIVLEPFESLNLERLVPKIEEENRDNAIKLIAKKHRRFDEADAEYKAQKDDEVEFELTIKKEDQILKGMKKIKGQLIIGEGKFPFVNVEDKLVGVKQGDLKVITTDVPAEFEDEEVAGSTLECEFKILSVKKLHRFDSILELAKEFECDSEEAFNKKVFDDLTNSFALFAKLHMKRHLLDNLVEDYDFPLPQYLVEQELSYIWHYLEKELENASSRDEVLGEDAHKSDDELRQEYRTIAERRVRLGLIVRHIIETQKIQLSDNEVRQAVYQEVMNDPANAKSIMDLYKQNPDMLRYLVAPLLEDKVIDFILSKAKINDVSVSLQEFKQKIDNVVPVDFEFEGLFSQDDSSTEDKGSKKAAPKQASKKAAKDTDEQASEEAPAKTPKKAAAKKDADALKKESKKSSSKEDSEDSKEKTKKK